MTERSWQQSERAQEINSLEYIPNAASQKDVLLLQLVVLREKIVYLSLLGNLFVKWLWSVVKWQTGFVGNMI